MAATGSSLLHEYTTLTTRRHTTANHLAHRLGRLRFIVIGGLLALVVPSGYLAWHAQQQIKWEALYQNRALAEAFSQRIDDQLKQWIAKEEKRPVSDFEFLQVASQGVKVGYLQISPLSQWPVSEEIPGLLGYFQVDENGRFSSPLLPENERQALDWGVSEDDIEKRRRWNAQVHDILSANQLVSRRQKSLPTMTSRANVQSVGMSSFSSDAGSAAPAAPSAPAAESDTNAVYAQKGFDTLNQAVARQKNALGRIEELRLDKQFDTQDKKLGSALAEAKQKVAPPEQRALRKEQSVSFANDALPEVMSNEQAEPAQRPIKLFESEVDAYEIARLDSGHFVLFRKVWQGGRRLIQGFLIDQSAFIEGAIRKNFLQTPLATMCNLIVAFQGDLLSVVSGTPQDYRATYVSPSDIQGMLLLQDSLSIPLSEMQLIFSLQQLPSGPGARVVTLTSLVLLMALLVVFYLFYRLGAKQIRLAQQQQNFVSAVSHELKTPLTSIRMFSEMLKEGWVSPDKQREYYTYISEESERLSRLIANVLQLARMERQENSLDIKPTTLRSLMDLVRSRSATQLERAGFHLNIETSEAWLEKTVNVDADALLQIMLNLIDNALKFAAHADKKQIDIRIEQERDLPVICVRDYGPGVPPQDLSKIFDLFYRIGNELTRETKGTGIGLALVRELTEAMGGRVSVINQTPGAEFRVALTY